MKENEIGENGYGSMFLVLKEMKLESKNAKERETMSVADS